MGSKKPPAVVEIDGPAGLTAIALALVTLTAPLLGGSTALWARAALALCTGVLWLCVTPRRRAGWLAAGLALGLLVLGAAAFLPAGWFPAATWRSSLAAIPGLALPSTLSPQPWLTFEALAFLVVTMLWAWQLFSFEWTGMGRVLALRIFGAGIVCLALLSLAAVLFKFKVPFWAAVGNSPLDFGFFPNRNQTANVLAIGGLVVYALGSEAAREGKREAWGWFGGLLLICFALIAAYSRAGILLLFLGVAFWGAFSARLGGSARVVAIVLSTGLVLLSVLFVFGGTTLDRFRSEPDTAFVSTQDFRVGIYREAWKLAAEAPLLGHGRGNFEALFARSRTPTAAPNRPIHPESDWLWLAVESGWLAPAMVLGLLAWWARRCFPFTKDSASRLRCAAAVGVIAFALHGLVDVSGHRAGALWPALFLACLAAAPSAESRRNAAGALRAWGARALAIVPLGLGAFWLASYAAPLPTTATHQRLTAQCEAAPFVTKANGQAEPATEALRVAPLDWNLYFQRSLAETVRGETPAALRDLGVACALEPNWSDFCYTAGLVWLKLEQPVVALECWRQVVLRPSEDGVALFRQMLQATRDRPSMREVLRRWAGEKRLFLMEYLEASNSLEFALEGDRLLAEDPTLHSLTLQQRSQFFHIWAERDTDRFAAALQKNPRWLAEGWLLLAQVRANGGDFRAAYGLARRLGPQPNVPQVQASQSLQELDREFYLNPTELIKGLALYHAQNRAGRSADALTTVSKLQNTKAAPAYLWFLAGELQAERGEWEPAWKSWSTFYQEYLKGDHVTRADAPLSKKQTDLMKLGSEDGDKSPADFSGGLPSGDGSQ